MITDRLTDAIEALDAAGRAVKAAIDDAKEEMRSMASAHEAAIEERDEKIRALEENEEANLTVASEAAHRVCDAVERPVGKRTFTIPRNEEFDRAMISLHDAIGRNI